MDLGPIEASNSVLLAEAQSRAVSPSLPPICDIEPYRDGATNQQKKCHAIATLVMLSRWLHCSVQSDPAACFDGECAAYETRVDACYPA
jgi:hypothetical protein